MKLMNYTILTFIILGALNYGLIGFFNFDFLMTVFGSNIKYLDKWTYCVIGVCGIFSLQLYGKLDDN